MSPIDPETTQTAGEWLGMGGKVISFLGAFIAGIVATTWAVACRVSGYDRKLMLVQAEIDAIKEHAERCTAGNKDVWDKWDKKLDALHHRLDSLMLTSQCHYRKESREDRE